VRTIYSDSIVLTTEVLASAETGSHAPPPLPLTANPGPAATRANAPPVPHFAPGAGCDLEKVMLLDRVQKRQRISLNEHRRLKAADLVEGRYPDLMVAGSVAKLTGEPGRHIRERGFDKQYYLDLILALVREHGPASRRDIDDALLSKLPDRLTFEQKKRRVNNLLQELRHAGRIDNQGSRSRPQWAITKAPDD
jgi:hypothetical protein